MKFIERPNMSQHMFNLQGGQTQVSDLWTDSGSFSNFCCVVLATKHPFDYKCCVLAIMERRSVHCHHCHHTHGLQNCDWHWGRVAVTWVPGSDYLISFCMFLCTTTSIHQALLSSMVLIVVVVVVVVAGPWPLITRHASPLTSVSIRPTCQSRWVEGSANLPSRVPNGIKSCNSVSSAAARFGRGMAAGQLEQTHQSRQQTFSRVHWSIGNVVDGRCRWTQCHVVPYSISKKNELSHVCTIAKQKNKTCRIVRFAGFG